MQFRKTTFHTYLSKIVIIFFTACFGFVSTSGWTTTPRFDEGIDYKRLDKNHRYKKTKKIEVVEFFGLFCPHCRKFNPAITDWSKNAPENVIFKKLHVPFRELAHQRLYFTLKKMNLADKYINLLFREIQDNRLPLKNFLSIITWAEDNNINTVEFEENWNSAAVESSMKEATLLMKNFEIRGVPQIIVDGEFLTSPAMAGSNRRLIALLDYLISLRVR